MDRYVHTMEKVQEALTLRRGGGAVLWEYQVSHAWLTIRIDRVPGIAGNFHLRCGDCERIECDTGWKPVNIQIERLEDRILVQDGAHLRVLCGIVVGEYNVPPLFGSTSE